MSPEYSTMKTVDFVLKGLQGLCSKNHFAWSFEVDPDTTWKVYKMFLQVSKKYCVKSIAITSVQNAFFPTALRAGAFETLISPWRVEFLCKRALQAKRCFHNFDFFSQDKNDTKLHPATSKRWKQLFNLFHVRKMWRYLTVGTSVSQRFLSSRKLLPR